jgi:pimeloyl-ACP methyl ester carboxylesterase
MKRTGRIVTSFTVFLCPLKMSTRGQRYHAVKGLWYYFTDTVRIFFTRLTQCFHFLCDVWSTYFVLSIDVLAFLSTYAIKVNGAAYFYRNFVGLSQYFPKIYAIDQLGWGLSSRPRFSQYFANNYNRHASPIASKIPTNDHHDSNKDSKDTAAIVQTAESFFVESFEAWRKVMGIESMVLAGHSMGGLLAVAYAERYPQHVHHLVLISPAGVPEETSEMMRARAARTTWRFRLFETLFSYFSPGDVLRILPESMGRKWIYDYVTRRLPSITDSNEQDPLTEYLYTNNGLLPGSGEYCLPRLLKPSVFGLLPLQYRIPLLRVQSCSFLYGDSDWMDSNGGLFVEQACAERKLNGLAAPNVDVYQVRQAGHLLMLENSDEFNNGLIWSVLPNETKVAFGDNASQPVHERLARNASLPTKLLLNKQIITPQGQPAADHDTNTPPNLVRRRQT